MMAMPGFTAESSIDGLRGPYPNMGGVVAANGKHPAITPAFHCHAETHTPDPAHGYGSCYAHDWWGHDCLYVYCD